MNTIDVILITSVSNLILQPILQYLLHSRCSEVDIACIHCKREVLHTKDEVLDKDIEESQL